MQNVTRYEVGMLRSESNSNKRLANPNNADNIPTLNSEEPSVYPNPAANMITIVAPGQQEILQINVIDAISKTVLNQKAGHKEISVSLAGLPNGIYMVQMITGNKVFSKKVVKL